MFCLASIHYPEWVTAGATVAVAAGVVVALLGFWDARKTRDGQLLSDLSERWDHAASIDSLVAFTEHGPHGLVILIKRVYGAQGPATTADDLRLYYKLQTLPTLIETIGVLHDEGALSTDVIYKAWGPTIIGVWDSWREPIRTLRELDKSREQVFVYFEKLADEMNMCASRYALAQAKHRREASKQK